MGLRQMTLAALALGNGVLGAPVEERAIAAKYCDAATTVCYSEYVSPERIAYRIAIPDNATSSAPFDVLLQIQAPKSVGWAGIAWGGTMTNNPLTVAWANGNSGTISGRRATARTYPNPDTGSSYTILKGTEANATHWTVTALAKGVSAWGSTRLNPASTSVSFAYAQSAGAPATPADPNSRFAIHQSRGKFTHDLAAAKLANFNAAVASLAV